MWFINGSVFTGEGDSPQPLDLQIEGETITAVVPRGHARPSEGETVRDLAGATVLPGLLDVHTHPGMMCDLVDTVTLLPPLVTSLAELLDQLRTSPHLGETDAWIDAFGYDESSYPEGRSPDRHDLDQVSTTQPILIRRCDSHSGVANTRALELAGISAQTPDPEGAAFGREPDGTPDGRLIELAALEAVTSCLPTPCRAEQVDRIARLAPHFASLGIVGIGEMWSDVIPDPLNAFREAAARGPFPQTALYLTWDSMKADPPVLTEADRTGRVRIAGAKLFLDGTCSGRTAWTHDPYPGSDYHGLRLCSDEDLLGAAEWARANHVQISVHAMGDAAIDQVISLFEDQDGWMGELPSVRIEHCTLFTPERIQRVARARMPFGIVSHTIFYFAEYAGYVENLSPAQLQVAYPIRGFAEHLAHTALASDTPSTAWARADDVMVSVQAAVTRRAHHGADLGQDQAITVAQALELYTSRAAVCLPMTGLGRLEAGAEASLVILDRDPFTAPEDELARIGVAETWMAGDQVWPGQA